MSDPMMGQMQPPQAHPAEQAMKDTRSIYHPTDATAMKQDGTIRPDMTIKDFFATFGIDVDNDPLTKLIEFQKQQMGNADPLNKMKAISGQSNGSSPMTPPVAPAPVGRPPEVSAGINGLKTRMGA